MSLDVEVLEAVAKDGSMDYSKWPGMLEPLLERLDHIVYHEFPMPKIPPELAASFSSSQPPSSPSSHEPSGSLPPSSSNKENAPPSNLQTPPRPTAPPPPTSSASSERVPDSQPEPATPRPTDNVLPPPLLLLLNSIKSTLRSYFSSKPPHTIQRLAELILYPTRHYRTLPAYLRAVDRVVAVSSTADIFPLQQTGVLGDGNLANGVSNGGGGGFMMDNTLGSDESLGGALLTPIPWLTNTGLEGEDSDLLDEGGESGAVTQGELIRKEQEAGVVAISQQQTHIRPSEGEAAETRASPPIDSSEEVPHARGPPVLGVEDMGLQDGKGVQMILSNSGAAQGSVPDINRQQSELSAREGDRKKSTDSNGDADGDGDIALSDASAAREVEREEDSKKDTLGDDSTGLKGQETSTGQG